MDNSAIPQPSLEGHKTVPNTTTTPPLTTISAEEQARCDAIAAGNGDMQGATSEQSSITVTVQSNDPLTLEDRGMIWQTFQHYIGPTAAGCTLDMSAVLPAASTRRGRQLRRLLRQGVLPEHVGHGRRLEETEIRLMNFGPPTVLATSLGGE